MTTRLLRRVLRRVLECAFAKVLRRVLRRGSKKGLSRRRLEGRDTPFQEYEPLRVRPRIFTKDSRKIKGDFGRDPLIFKGFSVSILFLLKAPWLR